MWRNYWRLRGISLLYVKLRERGGWQRWWLAIMFPSKFWSPKWSFLGVGKSAVKSCVSYNSVCKKLYMDSSIFLGILTTPFSHISTKDLASLKTKSNCPSSVQTSQTFSKLKFQLNIRGSRHTNLIILTLPLVFALIWSVFLQLIQV